MSEIAEINKARTKIFTRNCLRMLSSIIAKSKLFWHIEGQLIRCSTSVSANYRAACLAQSTPAFVSKLSIVIEEVDECAFWLELLQEEGFIEIDTFSLLHKEAKELTNLFISARKKLNNRT